MLVTGLNPPKSGWYKLWSEISRAGILTLPDASEFECGDESLLRLDGISLVVETREGDQYRAYEYSEPNSGKFSGCKNQEHMTKIVNTLVGEFNLDDHKAVRHFRGQSWR